MGSSRLVLITWMPVLDTMGYSPASLPMAWPWMPKALGMEGPVTSASRMPTW